MLQAKDLKSKYTGVSSDVMRTRQGGSSTGGSGGGLCTIEASMLPVHSSAARHSIWSMKSNLYAASRL